MLWTSIGLQFHTAALAVLMYLLCTYLLVYLEKEKISLFVSKRAIRIDIESSFALGKAH